MLVEMNELRADLTNIPTSGRSAVTHTKNCIAVKSYISLRHKQSVVWIENLSNFKHFSDVKK